MKIDANPRWTLAAVAVTAVFSSAPFAVVAQSPAAIRGFNTITFSDSGGFAGGGTGLSAAVTGEGQVTVNNRRDGTQKSFRLSQKELGELTDAIQHVDWPTVQGRRYIAPGAHDLVVQDLKIDLLGVVYETQFDGFARIPQPLRELFHDLDRISRRSPP